MNFYRKNGSLIYLMIIVLVGLIIGCSDGNNDNGNNDDGSKNGDPSLSGSISISPTSATVGQELTATYTGTENVSYQWKRSSANVGSDSNKHTPDQAGSYTVTVSATGFSSKTSSAVSVTADGTFHDFTTDWSLLGFGSDPVNVVDAMHQRWIKAKESTGLGTASYTPAFYDILNLDKVVLGMTTYKGGALSYMDFWLRFIAIDDMIRIFSATTGHMASSATFDIAVIGNDGKGWLNEGITVTILGKIYLSEDTETDPIAIASLTGSSNITNISDLDSGGVYDLCYSQKDSRLSY